MKRVGSAVTVLFLAVSGLSAQETPQAGPEVTAQVQAAVQKALGYLASRQGRTGAFPGQYSVATTSMACLAFLADGNTAHDGPFASQVRRGLEYLRRSCTRSGFVTENAGSGMYGHGYATLVLAESLGMLRDPEEIEETRKVLTRAVGLLQRAQNRFGGWNSSPDGNATDDGSGAIAIMQITALRAARNAGVQVDATTIAKAKKYVSDMTNAEGWYAYNYGMRSSQRASSALTGAGIYMLGVMDFHADPRYEKGIRNLMGHAPFLGRSSAGDTGWSGWWYYTGFYSSLAIFQHGGEEWRKWYPAIRDELLRRQANSGAWTGDPYEGLFSAFAVLTLELPYRYLPIFQEGGRGAEGN